jgi:cytochrome o ubiquinol oxidase subunit 2
LRRIKIYQKIGLAVAVFAAVVALTGWYLSKHAIPVLQPAGTIGAKERNLMTFCVLLSAIIVVPVFALLAHIAWKYRESNTRATYDPDQDGSPLAETIWWLVPSALLAVISTVTWQSSYALDPYKPLTTAKDSLHVQVVALDWKWLFIYPDQQVASVNELAIPVGKAVDFEITSDAVMTSFWAPQLGGQMYAMPGMATHLNLDANKPGDYRGVAANISGKGFADMKFTVHAVSDDQFSAWIASAKQARHKLTPTTYTALARPDEKNAPRMYHGVDTGLYDTILMKYMMPLQTNTPAPQGVEPDEGATP